MDDRFQPEHPQGEDGEWFVEIYNQHYHPLYRYIFYKIHSCDAEDVLQEVWNKAAQNPEGLKAAENPKAWLYKMANDEIVDWYRKNSCHLERFVELDAPELENLPHWVHPWERLTRLQLEEALMKLTAAHREVMELHHIRGYSFIEIAEFLNIPLGTVQSRHHNAMLTLRKYFEEEKKLFRNEQNRGVVRLKW